jgi:hypothetical protein
MSGNPRTSGGWERRPEETWLQQARAESSLCDSSAVGGVRLLSVILAQGEGQLSGKVTARRVVLAQFLGRAPPLLSAYAAW